MGEKANNVPNITVNQISAHPRTILKAQAEFINGTSNCRCESQSSQLQEHPRPHLHTVEERRAPAAIQDSKIVRSGVNPLESLQPIQACQ